VPGWIAIAAALALYFFTSGMFMGLMGFIFGLIGMVLRLLVPLALVALGAWMLLNYRRREQAVKTPMPEKYEPVEDPVPGVEEEAEYTELDISVGPRPGLAEVEIEAEVIEAEVIEAEVIDDEEPAIEDPDPTESGGDPEPDPRP
jgi:hypothetical protein